jgi:ribosomal protein L16 Arg81 hydroxylase
MGPGGGGGSSTLGGAGWKATLIPAAAGLLGQLFNYLGKKKTNDAQNANNTAANNQSRADTETRARAAAQIYSKMLAFYGHGDLASEDQLYGALLKEPSPTVKIAGPSAFSSLGGVADSVSAGAQDYYYRQNQTQQQQQQADVWKQIMDLIMKSQTQTPVQGGTTPGGGYPYE